MLVVTVTCSSLKFLYMRYSKTAPTIETPMNPMPHATACPLCARTRVIIEMTIIVSAKRSAKIAINRLLPSA